MANFCGKCGSRLDKKTGLCPNPKCNKGPTRNPLIQFAVYTLIFLLISIWGCILLSVIEPEKTELKKEAEVEGYVMGADGNIISVADKEKELKKEKKLVEILYENEDFYNEISLDYDESGELIGYYNFSYEGEELIRAMAQLYICDEQGRLIKEMGFDAPNAQIEHVYATIEYLYDNDTIVGYRETEYLDMGNNEYEFIDSMEYGDIMDYGFEFDQNGNVIKQITLTPKEEEWTNREFFYDNDGRMVSILEDRRYGDHHFQNEYEYDYTYPSVVVVSSHEKLGGYESGTYKSIKIKDFKHINVPGVSLYEGYTIVADEAGYITSVMDDTGKIVYRFIYE